MFTKWNKTWPDPAIRKQVEQVIESRGPTLEMLTTNTGMERTLEALAGDPASITGAWLLPEAEDKVAATLENWADSGGLPADVTPTAAFKAWVQPMPSFIWCVIARCMRLLVRPPAMGLARQGL